MGRLQILEWFWKKVTSIEAMTNLAAALRAKLADSFRLAALEHSTTPGFFQGLCL